MKKVVFVMLIMLISVYLLSGCDNISPENSDSQLTNDTFDMNTEHNEIPNDPQSAIPVTSHGYVLYVSEDGFVAHINAYGNVFVKNKGSDSIDIFDTVIIEYFEANLFSESGSFDIAGEPTEQYSYTLEAISVRVADPSKGDPVFG